MNPVFVVNFTWLFTGGEYPVVMVWSVFAGKMTIHALIDVERLLIELPDA